MFLTSSFVYESARQAASVFIGEEPAIFIRPLQSHVTCSSSVCRLEGAEQCVRRHRGCRDPVDLHGLVEGGDHVFRRQSIFGSTVICYNVSKTRRGDDLCFCHRFAACRRGRPTPKLFSWNAVQSLTGNLRHRGHRGVAKVAVRCCGGQLFRTPSCNAAGLGRTS